MGEEAVAKRAHMGFPEPPSEVRGCRACCAAPCAMAIVLMGLHYLPPRLFHTPALPHPYMPCHTTLPSQEPKELAWRRTFELFEKQLK